MRIAVAGVGYVGLSNAVLLAQRHTVKTYNLRKEKADMINGGISPIVDREIESYLSNARLNLRASNDEAAACPRTPSNCWRTTRMCLKI